MAEPIVSFLISTFNRREAVLRTLGELHGDAAPLCAWEVIVVDNASIDGTEVAVREEFPGVRLLRQNINRGPVAKNAGLAVARGKYIVFLDDDSFPSPGAVDRMVGHFENEARLGAAVFTITLPDGSRECSAYPDVFIGCGTGLRKEALDQVGGLPDDFFMQAEEYDLSLRLLDAAWTVKTFADLHVTHLKTPAARFPARVMRLDVRNNLNLIGRYFPDEWVIPFARDWIMRYQMIAAANDCRAAFCAGLADGLIRLTGARDRRPVGAGTFERFARINRIEESLAEMIGEFGIRRLLFVDLGKNMLPYWRAARRAGVEIVAIADARLGGRGFRYRDVEILSDAAAMECSFDAAIVSNLSPIHAAHRRQAWRERSDRPVIDFFEAAA
jgi:GT2 family glycosyltransferase